MTYSKININGGKGKIGYVQNRNADSETENAIYTKAYPPHTVKTVYKKAETPEKAIIEKCDNENANSKSNFALKAMCCITSFALLITLIYASGIEAPQYVENGMIMIINLFKGATDGEKSEKSVYKTIGEKVLVEAKEISEEEQSLGNSNVRENIRFAKAAQKAGSGESKTDSEIQTSPAPPQVATEVIGRNLSRGNDRIYITNGTKLQIDESSLLEREYPIEKYAINSSEEPVVLILHTHGTESYRGSGANGTTRNEDINQNVVKVGEELKTVLESYGIPTLHSKTMHDEQSYINSYTNSKAEARELMKKYPSIKYVIDLHRDALGSSNGLEQKTYAEIYGEPTAQLMFVVGTNEGGAEHPNFADNMTVAAYIQKTVNSEYPNLMRPINIRSAAFNQNLCKGCLLLEVGSDANSMDEAISAVRMFGKCFAKTISE